MKKYVLLYIVAGLVAFSNAQARPSRPSERSWWNHPVPAGATAAQVTELRRFDVALRRMLDAQAGAPAAKTTAQMQRIIASSFYDGGVLADSSRYTYNSPVRGSYHGVNDLTSYDFSYYPPESNLPYVEGYFIDGDLRIKCDTATFRNADGVYRAIGFQYNAAAQPTVFRDAYRDPANGYTQGRERYTMTYSGTGHRSQLFHELDTVYNAPTPGPFLPDYRLYCFYGGTPSRVLRDSLAPIAGGITGNATERYLYNYTGSSLTSQEAYLHDGSAFQLYRVYTFTYDASNRIKTATVNFSMGSSLVAVFKDSLTYAGTSTVPAGTYISSYNGTSLQLEGYQLSTFNAQNLRDTSRYFDATGALNGMLTCQYNSYGNLTSLRQFDFAVSATTPQQFGRYYYELYDPTGINKGPVAALAATAYPNPVSDKLGLHWEARAGQINIQISDLAGRRLEMLSVPAAVGTAHVDMQRYGPGFYLVTLSDGADAFQSFKVTKR